MSIRPAEATRLPRGRHRLSREEVVRSQRERLLRGMATAMVDDGYVGTSVTGILKRASVSRQTFYELFSSKEDCFAATYAWAVELVLERMTAAGESPAEATAERGGPGSGGAGGDGARSGAAGSSAAGSDDDDGARTRQVERVLEAYLGALASAPELARVLLIESYAAGADALRRRFELQERFAAVIGASLGATTAEDRFACEALVGAVSTLVTARLANHDVDGLLALREPLAALVRREVAHFGREA